MAWVESEWVVPVPPEAPAIEESDITPSLIIEDAPEPNPEPNPEPIQEVEVIEPEPEEVAETFQAPVEFLSTDQIQVLGTDQISALTTDQLLALSAMTTDQLSAL
jgi:hypothetical protein